MLEAMLTKGDEAPSRPANLIARTLGKLRRDRQKCLTHESGIDRNQDLNSTCLYQWNRITRLVCYDHLMNRFLPNASVDALLPFVMIPKSIPGYWCFEVLRCMHCGQCIPEGDTRLQGCLSCLCDYCIRAPDFQYHRSGPGSASCGMPRWIGTNSEKSRKYVAEGDGANRSFVRIYRPICRATRMPLDLRTIYYVDKARALSEGDRIGRIQRQIPRAISIGAQDEWDLGLALRSFKF